MARKPGISPNKTIMILNDENHREIIESYSEQDWKPLFDLIPEIEKTSNFGEIVEGERGTTGIIQMPYYKESSIITLFLKIAYELPFIISFDWGSWDEGRNIAQNEDFDFDTIDIPTKCKLITAIVRNDRFCEGTLISAFNSGLILKIIRSIRNSIKRDGS